MPQSVLDACLTHLQREAHIGGYEAAAEAHETLENTYASIARLLGCHPDEVAIVENATRAWDMAFYSIPFAPGDRILTARSAYASNYIAFLQVTQRTGAIVEVIESDASGQIDVDKLRAAIDERVKLIALTHVPGNGGLVQPAAEVGQVAQDAGIPFLLDACQSAGQMPLDVETLGVDMLSSTSRKFLRGPRGVGFLYVRRSWIEKLEPPMLDLHAATWVDPDRYEIRPDARRFENWESHVAGKIGMGVAIDYALEWGLENIQQRVMLLADYLRDGLREVPGVSVHDLGVTRGGIVSFSSDHLDAEPIKARLRENGINVSVSVPSTTRLDAGHRGLPDLVRASVHYYNTDEEIARFCSTVRSL